MSLVSWRHPFGFMLTLVAVLVIAYIIGPLLVIIGASVGGTGYLSFPPEGFSLQWYSRLIREPLYLNGFLTSLRIASIVTVLSLLIGIPAAYALAYRGFRGASTLVSVFLSPLMLPGLVLAVALTIFFSHWPFAAGNNRLVLAHLIICIPCVLRVTIPAFQRLDPALEEAALNLGATPVRAFLLVTLPVVRSGLAAAGALAFIMSFDEFDMALFLSDPARMPLTVVLYTKAQLAFDPTLAAAASSLILMMLVLMILVQIVRMLRG